MKFIFKNIILTIRKEKAVFAVIILGILVASFVMNFSVGIYHEFQMKALNVENYIGCFTVEFLQTDEDFVSKGELIESLKRMDVNVTNTLTSFELSLDNDANKSTYISNADAICLFSMRNKEIIPFNDLEVVGQSWTDEEFNTGKKVAYDVYLEAFGNPETEDLSGLDLPSLYRKTGEEDILVFDGVEYQVIASQSYTFWAVLPIHSVPDNVVCTRINFNPLNGSMTQQQYNEICDVLEQDFGDLVVIPYYEFKTFDQTYYYLVIILVVIISLISCAILVICYQFIIMQRKRNNGIFQLCGCSTKRVRSMFLSECMLILTLSYSIAVCFYEFVAGHYLNSYCNYIQEVANLKYYILIGIIYIAVAFLVLLILVRNGIHQQIIPNLKGGR